ncbi:MAG: PEP-CTERM sorting domain-containing protein [Candidatus Omnitrophica bacterium]|nr:PEP-CTERM sorting domain-containing protein [Candidatus Omnitrophota bacterium]
MFKVKNKLSNLLSAVLLLPFLVGCNGGGGGSSLSGLNGLFTGSSEGGFDDTIFSIARLGADVPEQLGVAVHHNPEPTTMLLLGTGLASMAYFKNKAKN